MSRWLWSMVLLSGCMPPVRESVDVLYGGLVAFFLSLLAAAGFSMLTAWGLVAIQRAHWQLGERRHARQAAIACLLAGGLYGAAALVSAWTIQAASLLPEAEPLLWLTWPSPSTLPGTALLSVAAVARDMQVTANQMMGLKLRPSHWSERLSYLSANQVAPLHCILYIILYFTLGGGVSDISHWSIKKSR